MKPRLSIEEWLAAYNAAVTAGRRNSPGTEVYAEAQAKLRALGLSDGEIVAVLDPRRHLPTAGARW